MESEDILIALMEQLDSWIISCEEQSEIFDNNNMGISGMTSDAMKHAYNNVKNFIQNKL